MPLYKVLGMLLIFLFTKVFTDLVIFHIPLNSFLWQQFLPMIMKMASC